jgi:hypothetical protein
MLSEVMAVDRGRIIGIMERTMAGSGISHHVAEVPTASLTMMRYSFLNIV